MMRKLWTAIAGSFVMLLVMMPSLALAAKKAAANVVIVADTRRLDGIMLWWAQMYNDSHLYFTILTIIIIPTVGRTVVHGIDGRSAASSASWPTL